MSLQPLHSYCKGHNKNSKQVPLGSPMTVTLSNQKNWTQLPDDFTLALYLTNETAVSCCCLRCKAACMQ